MGAGVLGAILVFIAIGPTVPPSVPATNSNGLPWGPLAVLPPSQGQPQARTGGVLRITADCVLLENLVGRASLLAWPADRTTWDAEELAVVFESEDDGTLRLKDGDQIIVGGGGSLVEEGGLSGPEWIQSLEWVAKPAASCPLDARWTVSDIQTTVQDGAD